MILIRHALVNKVVCSLSGQSESVQVFLPLTIASLSVIEYQARPARHQLCSRDRYGILHSRIICFPENRAERRFMSSFVSVDGCVRTEREGVFLPRKEGHVKTQEIPSKSNY
jgi:hypothetical protein